MRRIASVLGGAALLAAATIVQSADAETSFIELIEVPSLAAAQGRAAPVVVAVIDDGIRLSHRDLAAFAWSNDAEVPGNGIDDEGNGFIDDLNGWDVADRDNAPTPPDYRDDYYHGTHTSGIVAQILSAAYGDQAADRVKIMAVKAVADDDPTSYVRSGYAGIDYAINAGADIILTPWVIGQISPDEERILDRAAEAGIVVVASSGNLPEERDQFPAAHPSVIAVGSIESDGSKSERSNYGQFVDLSAPGSSIRSASIESDESYSVRDGTSFSAAMVAAAATIVKLEHPALSRKEIEACLVTSATPIPVQRKEMKGKVGAGALNVRAAVACDALLGDTADALTLVQPKGFLSAKRRRGATLTWAIEPDGQFNGIRFYPVTGREQSTDGRIDLRSAPDGPVLQSYPLDELPDSIYVPGSRAYVSFEPRRKRRRVDWLLEYAAETVDFSTLYCSGTKRLQSEGELADGSGPDNYSANSDCKWLITAPPGKVVQFTFEEIDTEPRTDMIYFFNGTGTHEPVMAIFSGQELPPELPTWSNQVLVWFVSDGQNEGGGWKARYRFIDPPW